MQWEEMPGSVDGNGASYIHSISQFISHTHTHTKQILFSKAYLLSVLSSALWDLCGGQLLQRRVEDDPSRGHGGCTLSSQRHGYVQTTATQKTVRGWLEALFDDTDPCACVVQQYTGLILRRCTLDEEGIAYWENPTYMKCISNDYRSIQTLVSISGLY